MRETEIRNGNEVSYVKTVAPFDQELPLSAAQSGMWFMQKLISPDSTFNIAEAIEIHGPINPTLFQSALRQVASEAETVRTSLRETIDGPRQQIAAAYAGEIPFLDFSGKQDPKTLAQNWMREEFSRPVDLISGTLYQSALLKLSPNHFIYYHRSHHIVMDGFSGGLLVRRVADIYNAFLENRPVPDDSEFGPLNLLFEEEKNYRKSPRFERDREYWGTRFADRPKPVSLSSRPLYEIGGLLRHTVNLQSDKTNLLRRFAGNAGVSLAQFMIAAIATYLYRITGIEDLVLGMTVTGRSSARVRKIPGMMANVLPLRLAIAPNLRVDELLRRVNKEVLNLLRHQNYRYEELRRDLNLKMAHNQHLFSTVINIEPFDYDLRFGGHPITPHNLSNASAENLAIFVYDRGDNYGLTIDFDANSTLYSLDELIEHQERFVKLIEGMAQDANQIVSHIDILTQAERQQLLVDWNATGADYTQQSCLHQLIEEQVVKTPNAPAVIFEDQVLSYAELNARANQLARYLVSLGVEPESRVAICLERSFEMVICLLAVLKAGGAYVPLDPSYPTDRLAFMLSDSAPQVLLTRGSLTDGFLDSETALPIVDVSDCEQWARLPNENLDPVALGLNARNLAYMIYTSGSTGRPKGAMNEHRGVVNRLLWKQNAYSLTENDAVLQKTPFSFDVSVWEFFWPLMTGARLVMARPEGHKDPAYLVETIRKNKVSTIHFVPSMLQVFLEFPQVSTCTSLRQVMCSGEALTESLARRFHERLPSVKLHNLYGPTEAAVDVTSWTYSPDFSGSTIPLGKPIANTQIHVLDQQGNPTPVGVTGEIFIGGVQVGRGYWDRPDLTAERFVPDPFGAPGARLYRTGDLGRWKADGTLEYLGRNDFQVKLRGFRIELGEIEAQLAGHPDVREAAVMARENNSGDPRLVAYYASDSELSIQMLRGFLSERLPDYMIPSAFVRLANLPLSPNGKLDRNALPVETVPSPMRTTIEPRTPEEQKIAQIWQSIFDIDCLSVDDNFFELGGHSLQAVKMVAKVEAEFGKQLPLVALFKAPTIEQLARLITEQPSEGAWETVVKLHPGGQGTPIFCVPGIGGQCHYLYHLAAALGTHHPVYGFQPKGLDGHSEPHRNIPEMAEYYLERLLEIQAAGPYFLIGHSFGGSVAFEMAKRLEATGNKVGFVALLDSIMPAASDISDAALNAQSLRAVTYIYGREVIIEPSILEGLTEDEQFQMFKPHLIQLGIIGETAGLKMVRGLMNITKSQFRISYHPDNTPVEQMLYIQAEERFADSELPTLEHAVTQWKRLSRNPLVRALVPGNHLTMLSQDHAPMVAHILQRWIVTEELLAKPLEVPELQVA
ncbi:MAG: amino acid adenylation domain-containing protein [Gammaproteobacteria bacterium]